MSVLFYMFLLKTKSVHKNSCHSVQCTRSLRNKCTPLLPFSLVSVLGRGICFRLMNLLRFQVENSRIYGCSCFTLSTARNLCCLSARFILYHFTGCDAGCLTPPFSWVNEYVILFSHKIYFCLIRRKSWFRTQRPDIRVFFFWWFLQSLVANSKQPTN
jgi:hypothetical protein